MKTRPARNRAMGRSALSVDSLFSPLGLFGGALALIFVARGGAYLLNVDSGLMLLDYFFGYGDIVNLVMRAWVCGAITLAFLWLLARLVLRERKILVARTELLESPKNLRTNVSARRAMRLLFVLYTGIAILSCVAYVWHTGRNPIDLIANPYLRGEVNVGFGYLSTLIWAFPLAAVAYAGSQGPRLNLVRYAILILIFCLMLLVFGKRLYLMYVIMSAVLGYHVFVRPIRLHGAGLLFATIMIGMAVFVVFRVVAAQTGGSVSWVDLLRSMQGSYLNQLTKAFLTFDGFLMTIARESEWMLGETYTDVIRQIVPAAVGIAKDYDSLGSMTTRPYGLRSGIPPTVLGEAYANFGYLFGACVVGLIAVVVAFVQRVYWFRQASVRFRFMYAAGGPLFLWVAWAVATGWVHVLIKLTILCVPAWLALSGFSFAGAEARRTSVRADSRISLRQSRRAI